MADIKGADLGGMDQLAKTLDTKRAQLQRVITQVDNGVVIAVQLWHGNDSVQFVDRWKTTHRPGMDKALAALNETAELIRSNRAAQAETSAAEGAGTAGRSGGSGRTAAVPPPPVPGGDRGGRDDRGLGRNERRDRRNVESDRRRRRAEGGDGSNSYFNNDWAGRSILEHYLMGEGDWTIENDPRWTDYMKSNEMLTDQLTNLALDDVDALLASGQDSMTIDQTTSMEIENGEGIVGYQYLHGTNADAGGFERKGQATTVTHPDGSKTVTMNMTYTWNDVIDPNPKYQTDQDKSRFAEIITLGRADAYDIHITWSQTTTVEVDASGQVTSVRND